jgi:D-3-phosphoglycerate dehydrogenase / 2-oxoglutarate reductase
VTRLGRLVIVEPLDFSGATHERLERAGCEVVLGRAMWDDPDRRYTENELVDLCRGARAVMGASRERYGRGFFEAMADLVVLSKYGIGTERIDVASATQIGILVTHTPVGENVHAVAEHTVMLMLSLLRRLKPTERVLRNGGWRGPATVIDDLRGKVIGIVGFGHIGRQVRQLLDPWGAEFVASDPFADPAVARAAGVKLAPLRDLLAEADVVSVHVAATPETRDRYLRVAESRLPVLVGSDSAQL